MPTIPSGEFVTALLGLGLIAIYALERFIIHLRATEPPLQQFGTILQPPHTFCYIFWHTSSCSIILP
jgi:hypothetical protein